MESKKYTQFGTLSVIIMLPLIVVFTGMLISHGLLFDTDSCLYAVLILTFLACLSVFYKSTIILDDKHISFKLGIGVFGRSYKLSEIESCKPVKNHIISGWGIHKIPNGWLYNVSGLKAIELKFKNTATVIRIGTNKPDEIAEIIAKLINTTREQNEEYTSLRNLNSKSRNTYIAVAVVLIIVLLFNLYQYQPVTINLGKNQFEINGEYGFPINYRDIDVIDTITQMPGIKMRTNGFSSGKVCKGYFTLTNTSSAILFINYNVSPFVQVVLKNRPVVYFNLKDRRSTIEMFDKIKSLKFKHIH
ncbi:MAG: hypothetical protein Q8904_05230 [Bacteroidota bacterium]|nr:hypothetical protein [Bacteroidota bacterium]